MQRFFLQFLSSSCVAESESVSAWPFRALANVANHRNVEITGFFKERRCLNGASLVYNKKECFF